MRAVRLLRHALEQEPTAVLDIGVGKGKHAFSFLAQGSKVTGVDVQPPPLQHVLYEHKEESFELADFGDRKYDLVWCSHTLEHVPNVQAFLIKIASLLKEDGMLYIAVPTDDQKRFHVGHLTLWNPLLLMYNLVCAGINAREALWYTEYCTIGLCVKREPVIDLSWRTSMPSELKGLHQFMPGRIRNECGSWLSNNWPDPTEPRIPDPPGVTIGSLKTNLPPLVQLAYGPNPKLREGYEREDQETENT